MAGAQNGIMGDADFEFNVPQTEVNDDDLLEIQKAAKFSKTREYKRLKDHMEERIAFYQQFLPDGRALTETDPANRDSMWVASNAIIGELRGVMAVYEQADEVLKEAARVRRQRA